MRLNTAQRLALNLDAHIVIDAGAGTGKTSTIVDRVIEHYLTEDQRATRLLPKPERPSKLQGGMIAAPAAERIDLREWGGLLPGEVVLLTFTNRAADEMRDRLRRSIARLQPGPIGDDGTWRSDPRIRHKGFNEQLLTLLEDAPIGTIDAFLNQLVSPYRGILGDALSRDNVSDTGRILLVESALNTLWRLPSSVSHIGEAVDAGIPAEIAPDVLAARDRIARHYSGRRSAARVLRSLVGSSVFIEEAARRIMDSDTITSELLHQQIMASVDADEVAEHATEVHSIAQRFCNLVRENSASMALAGWPADSRMACLDSLSSEGPPEDAWGQLTWLSHTLVCTLNSSALMKNNPAFFPHSHLPSDSWEAGIEKYSRIPDARSKARVKEEIKGIVTDLKAAWSSDRGRLMLHFTRVAMLLSDATPPASPSDWTPPLSPLQIPLPERIDGPASSHYFTLDAEVRNLQDLYLAHRGFQGIIRKLKERDEVHDFDDIQRLAGDLLLANCPSTCRTFYHSSMQDALDSLTDSPWRDDHIDAAFAALERLEANPSSAGEAASSLGAIRADLESRRNLLMTIRRRYRAFIIDEAQDNSPLQWRLLSRLWGERRVDEGEPNAPDTPWQPTVCYVGDVKQSIYAFRQAEVTGFLEFARQLMAVNDHELEGVPELTRKPALRKDSHSRDPRNAHSLTIATATEYMEQGGRDLVAWIPFDATDRDLPAPSGTEVENRRRGLIALQVNYRTSGGLLRAMNEWWEDVFSDRHRLFPNGDFYATPQTLFACPDKRDTPGAIEWICPLSTGGDSNPPTDLTTHLDPFGEGKPDSLERQALLIARRVGSLIDGSPVSVRSADGKWHQVDAEDPVSPSEIMILLPTRPNIRDVVIRHLHDHGIPAQADREGGLLDRPAAHALEGLLQFVARPRSRHHASWVARSVLIGLDDAQLQDYIGGAQRGEDLLSRLVEHCSSDSQRALVKRWRQLSESGRLIDLLDETIDRSDLLTAYPDSVSRQDVEQIVDVIRALAAEVGGDAMVLADRIRDLRERSSGALEAITIPPGDAVRVMTIHSAKGLEAKVVVLADVFSNRQTNMRNENLSRLIVSPELFAGNPKPWSSESSPHSALWSHVQVLHQARKDAEARRLLYVGATRAEERLIVVGSNRGTEWAEGDGLRMPWSYDTKIPQLGQMWIESLRQGSLRRAETASPWLDEGDDDDAPAIRTRGQRTFDPTRMFSNASLGGDSTLPGMLVIHHPDCFEDADDSPVLTPLQRIERLDDAANSSVEAEAPAPPRQDSAPRIRITPNRLPVFQECQRRQWFETKGGLSPDPIVSSGQAHSSKGMPANVDPATLGTVFHRILEIGIGNPGLDGEPASSPLQASWTEHRENLLSDPETHSTVFTELLPPDADLQRTRLLVEGMAERIGSGPLGRMVQREPVDDHRLEGLRTEMPFYIALDVETGGSVRQRWSPEGPELLANTDKATIEMNGIIDLVLCTTTPNGGSAIRAVDLKTEDAGLIDNDSSEGLLEALGSEDSGPACEAELEILNKHRMQLALYYRALQSIEDARKAANLGCRTVLPPAILVGVTGRMVEYPKEMLDLASQELEELLVRTAGMALSSDAPLSDFDRLPAESAHICENCPFHRGALPICGPAEQ